MADRTIGPKDITCRDNKHRRGHDKRRKTTESNDKAELLRASNYEEESRRTIGVGSAWESQRATLKSGQKAASRRRDEKDRTKAGCFHAGGRSECCFHRRSTVVLSASGYLLDR